MSDTTSNTGSGFDMPDDNAIQGLMKACTITEDEARNLLSKYNNDPIKARDCYNQLKAFMTRSESEDDNEPAVDEQTFFETNCEFEIANTISPISSRSSNNASSENGEDSSVSGSREENAPDVMVDWDYTLPKVAPPANLVPGDAFDLESLIGAVQGGATLSTIHDYLSFYDPSTVTKHLTGTFQGIPTIFYAVARNNDSIIREWVARGGDVNATHETSKVPILAYAIMQSDIIGQETSKAVATLLSLGAEHEVVPPEYYESFFQDLPENGPQKQQGQDTAENHAWCTPAVRKQLAATANLTQRYFLYRASKTKRPTARHKQVTSLNNAKALLGVPYFLIGQSMTANLLLKKLMSYLLSPRKSPLSLIFAGPSGHGKTELARQLQYLLAFPMEIVDCTIIKHATDLFGAQHPYSGAAQGSSLNNFLAKMDGKRSVVFLDEFEKTTTDVHQCLLLPFDRGEYIDRRNGKRIDCSKTIWIMATNAFDGTIQDFSRRNEGTLFLEEDTNEKNKVLAQLTKIVKGEFLQRFQPPLTGRITAFLPFLPFSEGEQAVVAHKFLLGLAQDVKLPVNLANGQLIGNLKIRLKKDASLCRSLAEEHYHVDMGARSLENGVAEVMEQIQDAYLDVLEEIEERDDTVDVIVQVINGELKVNVLKPTEP